MQTCLLVIIIDNLETKLLESKYAKIDSKNHRPPYPMIIITQHNHSCLCLSSSFNILRSSLSLINELMLIMFMVFPLCGCVCVNSWTSLGQLLIHMFIKKLTFQPASQFV